MQQNYFQLVSQNCWICMRMMIFGVIITVLRLIRIKPKAKSYRSSPHRHHKICVDNFLNKFYLFILNSIPICCTISYFLTIKTVLEQTHEHTLLSILFFFAERNNLVNVGKYAGGVERIRLTSTRIRYMQVP